MCRLYAASGTLVSQLPRMELLIGPIRSQDLGRCADLEHVWAVGVAIAVRKDDHGH